MARKPLRSPGVLAAGASAPASAARPHTVTPSKPASPAPPQPPPGPSHPVAEQDVDLELIRQIRAGDAAAWSRLLERYQDRIYTLCLRTVSNRDLAADLAQDTMVKVIQGLDSYDGRSKLSTWIFRVTMNVCLSKLRSEKVRRHASIEALGAGPEDEGSGLEFEQEREPDTAPNVQEREERRRFLAALDQLEPDQRAILILRDSRGLDYDEIAGVLNVAVGTVKSRLFRARQALREAVERGAE
jgi:RNA polymerase sigma-70 factor (ECF subfamily)